jgi:histidinol dehydrogenase
MRTAGGGELGMRFQPLDRVGVYVPGGRAVYPSSALMNILPARVAGVREVVVCTPSRPDGTVHPFILAACDMAGADRIYRLGGAQAIAALALGTATIPAVDLIAGPGGAYVAEAKRQVYGRVGIDSIAGPTEIVIIADRTADPALVAADLFAQAEHDEQAAPILVTTDLKLAVRVRSHLRWFLAQLGDYRNGIPVRSLYRNGRFVIARDIDQALMIADLIAPEHLEILAAGADKIASRAKNAGAIFIGPDSPVAAGDYYCGTNHVLPTGGSARFASALGVDDFTRRVQVIKNTARDLSLSSSPVMRLAEAEGLLGHGLSIRARRK